MGFLGRVSPIRAVVRVRGDCGQPLRVPPMPRRERQPAAFGGFPHKAALAAETAAEQRMVRLGAAHSLKGAGGDQQRTRRGGDGIRSEFGAAAGVEQQDIGGAAECAHRYRDQGAVADAGDQNGSECTGTDGMGDPLPDPGGGLGSERAGGQPRTDDMGKLRWQRETITMQGESVLGAAQQREGMPAGRALGHQRGQHHRQA